ncbi:MAG: hypothetical protein CBE15_05600 [Euryarchaeota archaeon TMED255]|nr:MAG: hypothetical protein CBE15_05600 [Euryarchaeota archaeon TMED255]
MITADNIFAIGALLFGLAWLGFWIDVSPLGKKTSGVIWVLVVGMILSNIGAVPLKSPVYDFVGGNLVPLAIPLLLFKADLREIFTKSGAVMVTFLIASCATVMGVMLGFFMLDLGEIGPKVAGVYAGAWIGGAVNMLAVSQAVQMTPNEFSLSISASSLVSILALYFLLTIPSINFISRWISNDGGSFEQQPDNISESVKEGNDFILSHVSGALALSFLICWISKSVSETFGYGQYSILVITTLTLLFANIFPQILKDLRGDFEIGMLLMYLFFAVVGAGTDATAFISNAPLLFIYGLIIIFIHLSVVLFFARLLKIELPEAIIASGAALVGPAPTAAIASSKGWRHLITPGIMCGIFGYAIATFIGVSITAYLG